MNSIITLTNEQELACQELAQHIKKNLYGSLAPSTRIVYRNDFYIFTLWCEKMGLSRCPATPETVAGFITAQDLSGIKPATLIRRLAAIKKAHEAYKHPNPTNDPLVKSVLKGIKRNRGSSQDKKAAATAERLEQMVSFCIPTTLGVRDKAILLLGFAGAFRRSELVSIQMKDIERTPEGIKITIPKSKGDQEGKGQTIAILNGTRFRVVDHLYFWLKQAKITEGFIFRSVRKNGKVQDKPLRPREVARIVKKYAGLAGFTKETFAGHSLRAGFITSGANAGADLIKLMEVSRHKKPETVLGYVRESKLFENHAGEKFL
jgi:integrase